MFGDVQLDRTLLRFIDRADDVRPALEAMAADFLRMETEQFRSEGAFASEWHSLNPDYAEAKRLAVGDKPILQRSGDLMESLTNPADEHHVRIIDWDELFVGTDIEYARFHQTGTGNKRGRTDTHGDRDGLPMRRPVEFRETDRRMWVQILQRWLVTGETRGRSYVRTAI